MSRNSGRVHLDYASTTPVRPEVLRAMKPYWNTTWANPSAIYREGVLARMAIETSRTELARTLGVRQTDIIFTSGGTEANNLALIGAIESLHRGGRTYESMEVISLKIEHPSVLRVLEELVLKGVTVRYVDTDTEGRISLEALKHTLTERTVLVSCAYVNSEIGTVQDLRDISRVLRAFEKSTEKHILFHTDASQAPLWLPCNLESLGVDLMTLDAGKCYGPKGVGVLVKRHRVHLVPTTFGGGQERGLRSGTENVPLIIGCVHALVLAQNEWKSRSVAVAALRDSMFSRIEAEIPEAVVNGSRVDRVANNVNISLPGIDTEFAVIVLDKEGIAASTKSACGTGDENGSSVVRVCTGDDMLANATLRFTLGEETREDDIDRAVGALSAHLRTTKENQKVFPSLKN